MSKHTQGPWILSTRETDTPGVLLAFCIDSAEKFNIASSQSQEHLGQDGLRAEEMLANANLIAAAPELLEALEALADRYNDVIGNEGVECYKARAAIAKARGDK